MESGSLPTEALFFCGHFWSDVSDRRHEINLDIIPEPIDLDVNHISKAKGLRVLL
jgi:hypothetical protein